MDAARTAALSAAAALRYSARALTPAPDLADPDETAVRLEADPAWRWTPPGDGALAARSYRGASGGEVALVRMLPDGSALLIARPAALAYLQELELAVSALLLSGWRLQIAP